MKKQEHHILTAQFEYSPERKVEIIKIIRTTLTKYGAGTEKDPIREIEQFWSLDGKLLWENDPHKIGGRLF